MAESPPYHMYSSGPISASIVLQIFVASLRSVATAAVLALPGVLLARKGVITRDVSRGLSHVSMQVTIPCLLFSSVVPDVSVRLLRECWPLLVLPFIYVPLGLLIGALVVLICEPSESFRKGTVAAVAFGNSTGIPIVLLSVVHAALKGPNSVDPMLFLSVYLIFYPALQWAVGGWLLGVGKKHHAAHDSAHAPAADTGARGGLSIVIDDSAVRAGGQPHDPRPLRAGADLELRAAGAGEGALRNGSRPEGGPAHAPLGGSNGASGAGRGGCLEIPQVRGSQSDSMPNLYGLADGERFMVDDGDDNDDESSEAGSSCAAFSGLDEAGAGDGAQLGAPRARALSAFGAAMLPSLRAWGGDGRRAPGVPCKPAFGSAELSAAGEQLQQPMLLGMRRSSAGAHQPRRRGLCARLRRLASQGRHAVRQVCKPAVVAVACGIAVGLTPALKALILPMHTAPFGWAFTGVTRIGSAAVPINLMLLGATLSKGPCWANINVKTNVGIVVAKMVVSPLVGAGERARARVAGRRPAPLCALARAAQRPASRLALVLQAS